jgi:hypothetical protein
MSSRNPDGGSRDVTIVRWIARIWGILVSMVALYTGSFRCEWEYSFGGL